MNITYSQSLLRYNTFGIDACADVLVTLTDRDDYRHLLEKGILKDNPYFVLGGGSNVVFKGDFKGVIVHPDNKGIRLVEQRDGHYYVEADAGEVWSDFVNYCIAHDWYGLENLAAIPGCVGAAPVQNVGAYGKEAKDVVDRVHMYDIETGDSRWMRGDECHFAYRDSLFKNDLKGKVLIDRVVFRLDECLHPEVSYSALAKALAAKGIEAPSARQIADTVTSLRDSKLPNPIKIGSAGSFFKNPVVSVEQCSRLLDEYPDMVWFKTDDTHCKIAAGWLIEYCGWKGHTLGNVGVYDKQALVLVNRGGCTGGDVVALANAIIADVEARFDIRLEPEAIFV